MKDRRNALVRLLLGVMSAALTTLAAMLLMAAALMYLKIGDTAICYFNQSIKLFSAALGACAAVPRGGERGLLTGMAVGFFYCALGCGVCRALGGVEIGVSDVLGETLLCGAAGAVTGVIRANLAPRARSRSAKR